MPVSEKIRKVSTITLNIILLSVVGIFVREYSVTTKSISEFSEVSTQLEFESRIAERIKFTSVIELEAI